MKTQPQRSQESEVKDNPDKLANAPNVSVLIVGAGLTGLTLACDLARRGIDFRIIEKAAAYFVGSRGKTLQPRSLEVLDDLGVIDPVLKQGRFHLLMRSYQKAGVVNDHDPFAGLYPTPDVPYAAGLWIPQFQVEETLRQQIEAHGKRVELATELTSIDQNEQGVTATLQKEGQRERVHCQYLIGADGGRSFVRKFLNFSFAGDTLSNETWLVGDVHVDGLDREHLHVWNTNPAGVVGLCPFVATDIFQFQGKAPVDFEGEPSLEIFQQVLNERSGRTDLTLYDPTWLSLFHINVRMVDQYRVGNVFLAGDAAHVHSPAGGQGLNTGIQDAYNLGWKLSLVIGGANPSLLDTYEEERLPVAASVLGLSKQLFNQFKSSEKQLPSGTDMLQLGIHYRASSLSQHENTSLPLPHRAGDRAPDAPLLDGYGKRIRLFDLFRGPHFTLLSIGGGNRTTLGQIGHRWAGLRVYTIGSPASGTETGAADLVDDQGHVADGYGQRAGVLYLIRPDGYIGWIGGPESADTVETYLKRFNAAV